MPTLHQAIIVALIAAFIILFITKTELRWSIRDFCDKIKMHKISEMFDCTFCLSFWTCAFVCFCLELYGIDIDLIVLFCSPTITRYLV